MVTDNDNVEEVDSDISLGVNEDNRKTATMIRSKQEEQIWEDLTAERTQKKKREAKQIESKPMMLRTLFLGKQLRQPLPR